MPKSALVENQPVVDALVNLLDLEPVEPRRLPRTKSADLAAAGVRRSGCRAGARRGGPNRRRGPAGALVALLLHSARRPGRPDPVPGRAGAGRAVVHDSPSRRRPARQDDLHSRRLVSAGPGRYRPPAPMPAVPAPETCRRFATATRGTRMWLRSTRGYRARSTSATSTIHRGSNVTRSPGTRAASRLDARSRVAADDPVLHVCALTFASDLTLLDSVLIHHGLAAAIDPVRTASLDHAMWFHRSFRADEWFLYVTSSPSASGGRGLADGRSSPVTAGTSSASSRRACCGCPALRACSQSRVCRLLQLGPRCCDMPPFRLGRANGHSKSQPTGHGGVGEVHPTGRVDPLHELPRRLVAGSQPEGDERQRMRADELEAIVGCDPGGEFLRECHIATDVGAQALCAVPANDGPQLEGAEAAPSGTCQSR